jgi:hypothetical protein
MTSIGKVIVVRGVLLAVQVGLLLAAATGTIGLPWLIVSAAAGVASLRLRKRRIDVPARTARPPRTHPD